MINAEDRAKMAAKKGLRIRVDMMCKDCIYDPLAQAGTWRKQVENCTVTLCPLWDVRPKSDKRIRQ